MVYLFPDNLEQNHFYILTNSYLKQALVSYPLVSLVWLQEDQLASRANHAQNRKEKAMPERKQNGFKWLVIKAFHYLSNVLNWPCHEEAWSTQRCRSLCPTMNKTRRNEDHTREVLEVVCTGHEAEIKGELDGKCQCMGIGKASIEKQRGNKTMSVHAAESWTKNGAIL